MSNTNSRSLSILLSYNNIHMLSISLLYYYHKANIFSNVIVLVFSTLFQTYDITSCDASWDCGHMPLHHPRKEKEKNI